MKYQLLLCALLLAALSTVSGQVASHEQTSLFKANAAAQLVGKPVVRVNGAVLTDRDLMREMYTIFPYARQHNGGFPAGMESDIRKGAMKMIVFEELMYQEAQRRGLVIAPVRMQQATADFRKQFNSQAEYQQFMQEEFHGSQQLLRAKIKRSLLIDKLMKLEVANKSAVTVAEAKAYYDKQPEHFRTPESISIQTISIVPPANATPVQLKEAAKRAEDAQRQAKATKTYEEFGLLAERLSEDDYRVMMGDHKAADRSKLPPEVVNAALALKTGEVSNLIHFDNVYTVLRMNGHTPAGLQKFEEVKDTLRGQLQKQKTEQLRAALSMRLQKTAKIEEL